MGESILTEKLHLGILGGAFLGLLSLHVFVFSFQFPILLQMGYSILVLYWICVNRYRIVDKSLGRLLQAISCCLILYYLSVSLKYYSTEDSFVNRLPWYFSYIPLLMVTVFSMFTAGRIGKREEEEHFKFYRLLYFGPGVMGFLFLTNDIHNLAFRFHEEKVWTGVYFQGPLYYAMVFWVIACLCIIPIIVYTKCKNRAIRRKIWVPFMPLLFGLAYFILYDRFYLFRKMFLTVDFFSLMIVGFWEGCIFTGLIPSNTGYRSIFSFSSANAFITDEKKNIVYCSEQVAEFPIEVLQMRAEEQFILDENTLLKATPIHGGYVYWQEDLTKLNSLKEELADIRNMIAEENDLLKAEQELGEDQAQIRTRNNIYDCITEMTQEKLSFIEKTLNDLHAEDLDKPEKLGYICVLNAYVKRFSNLFLLSQQSQEIQIKELDYCVMETMNCLKLLGVACSLESDIDGMVPALWIQTAYQWFEKILEGEWQSIMEEGGIIVRLAGNFSGFRMRVVLEGKCKEKKIPSYNSVEISMLGGLVKAWTDEDDEQTYRMLEFRKGGVF